LKEYCKDIHPILAATKGEDGNLILAEACDPTKVLRWKAQSPLSVAYIIQKHPQSVSVPCVNVPPGRVDAQVKITYRKAKSSFDHIAYGELSSNVIWV